MARHTPLLASLLALMALGGPTHAQSVAPTSVELDLDARARVNPAGGSGVSLHTSALRLSSGLAPGLRVTTYGMHQYGHDAVQEAQVEKSWGAQRAQAGLVRLPFGLYDLRETYASGLIDYPMPRGDYAYHSVDWGVPGVEYAGGSDRLQVEAAAFGGRSTGIWDNFNTARGAAARVQTYAQAGPATLILGVSRWDGSLEDLPGGHVMKPVHLTGVDVRYTRPHWLLRGEYLTGELAGDREWGAYLDAYYHLPGGDGKWTLTGRLEALRPGADDGTAHQVTLGARYVASREWILAVNWRRNDLAGKYQPSWVINEGKGDIYLQAYRKFNR